MRMSTEPAQHLRSDHTDTAHKPWYRHGWVWFLIAIPGSAIIAGSITIWIAITTADSLVADDYYKEGRAINQRLEKDMAAADRGIALEASIRSLASGSQRIEVAFAAKPGVAPPEFIRLRLSHPTLNQMDILATLVKSGDRRYSSDVPGIAAGRWYAQLEDDQSLWRVKATWMVQ
ncbi:MAG: FixH family protein [Burkholderiaceae bacterium]|nr:FixH family protein [Burkholderiaceae bacterium]